MRRTPEHRVLAAVRDHLRLQGFFVIRHQAGLGTHPGLSDLTAVLDGVTYYIECKAPRGRLSEAQEQFRRDIEAAGATYIVARRVSDVSRVVGGCLWLDDEEPGE